MARTDPEFSTHILTQILSDVVDQCVDSGMQPPLTVVAAGSNGSVSVTRFSFDDDEWSTKCLAEHFEPEGLRMPLHLLVIDRTGEANHIAIMPDETVWDKPAGRA